MDIKKLKEEQLRLSGKVELVDGFSSIKIIAGVDQSFVGETIISAVILMDYKTLKIIETAHVQQKVNFPYIPGYLSYREAPAIIEAFSRLKNEPDMILVDGNGILHPRKIGLASHVGLALDKPTIGIAKSLLCGELRDNSIYLGQDIVAKRLATRDIAKPVYISPGHKIGFKSMMEIVKHCLKGHKLPEPVHEAHKAVTKLRRKLKEKV